MNFCSYHNRKLKPPFYTSYSTNGNGNRTQSTDCPQQKHSSIGCRCTTWFMFDICWQAASCGCVSNDSCLSQAKVEKAWFCFIITKPLVGKFEWRVGHPGHPKCPTRTKTSNSHCWFILTPNWFPTGSSRHNHSFYSHWTLEDPLLMLWL